MDGCRRLDELETAEELKANVEKKPVQARFFPQGKDGKKRPYQDFRWSRFKNLDAREMYTVVDQHVFPWLRTLGGNASTYSKHMEGARFTIPTPALLAKVVDMIDKVPMEREPGHHLSRFAGAGPCRGRREVHAGAGQSPVRRVAGL